MFKGKGKQVITRISGLCFLVMLLTAGSFAWFINYSSNKLNVTSVQVSAGNVMEISMDNETFANSLSNSYASLNMKDITGDGKTFLLPVLQNNLEALDSDEEFKVNVASVDTSSAWSTPLSTADCTSGNYGDAKYISFKLYFKANVAMDIYLTNSSYVSPANPNGNLSNYAATDNNFSCDYIAAASRVSFVNSEDSVVYVWAPNSGVELYYDTDIDSKNNGYKLKTSGGSSQSYSYYKASGDTYQLQTYDLTANDCPLITSINTTKDKKDTSDKALLRLVKNNNTNKYEGYLTVNLWIEGTDREAKRALAGGNITMNLIFAAFDISE